MVEVSGDSMLRIGRWKRLYVEVDLVSQNGTSTASRPSVVVACTNDGYLRDAYR